MSIRFGEITRGHGKIFVRIVAKGLPGDVTLRLTNRTAQGRPLPSMLVDAPEGISGWVAVLPVLTCAQELCVEAVDADAAVVGSARRTISERAARLRSRINTATRNRVALAIRNMDDSLGLHPMRCQVDSMAADAGGVDVMRLSVVVPVRTAVSDGLAIHLLDQSARPLDAVVAATPMSGVAGPGEVADRTLVVTAKVPAVVTSFLVWARDEATGWSDFICFEQGLVAHLHQFGQECMISAQDDVRYDGWFRRAHRATPAELERQRGHVFEVRPTFSIVVPLFRTPLGFLDDMVGSVLAQTYPNLELILVNASPDDKDLAQAVSAHASADARIRVVTLDGNHGITENTNAGIAVATGDFLCFLDHDDVVEPDLLYCYVQGINAYPETDLLYCDEDKLGDDGRYFCPFLKPDWSPELMYSFNYVCHLLTVRKAIVDGLEPPTRSYDGAQDYHMTFRVAEQARNVYHARRVLYHWRSHQGSTAGNAASKDYTTEVGRRVIQEHLDRCGIAATAVPDAEAPNAYHVSYETPGNPLVSIVIPNKDQPEMLERCVTSVLERSTYGNLEVVIVENNSEERETFALYERLQATYAGVHVVELRGETSFNFSRIVNHGVACSHGEYVLLLNNDTQVISPDWVENLLGPCMCEGIGIAGAKLLYPDDTIQHGGVVFHMAGPDHLGKNLPADSHSYFNLLNLAQNLVAVTGACLMVSRALYDELGGLDESFAVNYNDIDFCLRARERGQRVVWRPEARLYHFESVSRGIDDFEGDNVASERFRREYGQLAERWDAFLTSGDPYMSPSMVVSPLYRQLDAERGRTSL